MQDSAVAEAVRNKLKSEETIHEDSARQVARKLTASDKRQVMESLMPVMRHDIITKATWSNLPRSQIRKSSGPKPYRPLDILEHLLFENSPIIDFEPCDEDVFEKMYQMPPVLLLDLVKTGHVYLNLYVRDPNEWAGREYLTELVEHSFSMGARVETALKIAVPTFRAALDHFEEKLQWHFDKAGLTVPKGSRAPDPRSWVRRLSINWAYTRIFDDQQQTVIDRAIADLLNGRRPADVESVLNILKDGSVSVYSAALGGIYYTNTDGLRNLAALDILRDIQPSSPGDGRIEDQKTLHNAHTIQEYLKRRYRGLPSALSFADADILSLPWRDFKHFLADGTLTDERRRMKELADLLQSECDQGNISPHTVEGFVDYYDKTMDVVKRLRATCRSTAGRLVTTTAGAGAGIAAYTTNDIAILTGAVLLFPIGIAGGLIIDKLAFHADKVFIDRQVDDLLLSLPPGVSRPRRRIYELTTYPVVDRRPR